MNLKSILLPAALALTCTVGARAQAVIFPQAQQPGSASLATTDGSWTLSNSLLSATFTASDGTLRFGGCPEMGLLPSDDLFRVQLADGTVLTQADMAMGQVTAENLTADPAAPRGSDRFAGHAISTTFTRGNLRILWRAVLRDGSHYLRTEMELSSPGEATAMHSVIPMTYDVADDFSVPQVVGNTRGAVLLSDRVFAGLETPMGVNTAGAAPDPVTFPSVTSSDFVYGTWTPESFSWTPGTDLPKGIADLDRSVDQVVGTRGTVIFTEGGEQTVTFVYGSGTHGLNILGVDIIAPDGSNVSSDYHIGFSGGVKRDNVYTVRIPEPGPYTVRYFISLVDSDKKPESITSSGTISYSKPVSNGASADTPVLPSAGRDHYYILVDKRSSRYVTEQTGNLLQGSESYASAESRWHFISRPDGTWDIVNSATGNFIAPDAAYNAQLTTSASAPASGWEIKPAGQAGKVIISNGECQLHMTNGSNSFKVFNWGGGSKTDDDGCIFAFGETVKYVVPQGGHFEGLWSRNVSLAPDKTWRVSAVVGLVAPGQARRSFLAYSERERAVAWHPIPIYNSWYELNIDRNNDPNYTSNFNIGQCVEVVEQWHKNLYEKHGANIGAFVWDDGWDNYGTWTFNPNFPNGFSEADKVARDMNTGIGAWLGPVGGYGQSGNYRRNYWNGKGGMQLSNPDYYKTFLDAVTMLTSSYDFRFFKFDGISAQFSSTGPDSGTTGLENAEAIIDIEQRVREIKPDIYLNTTVGTWASPFWFRYTDAVWRQEKDHGTEGPGNSREQWITYRDRLVYQNFVKNSPICPINNLMTHGFMLSNFGGGVAGMSRDYEDVRRELRCAFACGSGMVELYADFALLNEIKGGALWGDIADCIKWQNANADVLPDAHWVGGNPWDGSKAEIYGWASWNGRKATLALRNGADRAQSITFTLREALDIPAYVSTSIELSPSFADIPAVEGLATGSPLDADREITVTLPAHSFFMWDGKDLNPTSVEIVAPDAPATPVAHGTFDLSGRRLHDGMPSTPGVYIVDGRKVIIR